MSTSINMHIEIKAADHWFYYAPVHISAEYRLFARLADVRNGYNIEPIDQPRGLPNDVSAMIKLHKDTWGTDSRFDSYIDSDEYVELVNWLGENNIVVSNKGRGYRSHDFIEEEWIYLFGNTFFDFRIYPDDYPEWLQDYRLVFWFD